MVKLLGGPKSSKKDHTRVSDKVHHGKEKRVDSLVGSVSTGRLHWA